MRHYDYKHINEAKR